MKNKKISQKENTIKKSSEKDEERIKLINKKKVQDRITAEKQKADARTTINDEFTQKIILYGYVMVNKKNIYN